jgi:hypothetical protein
MNLFLIFSIKMRSCIDLAPCNQFWVEKYVYYFPFLYIIKKLRTNLRSYIANFEIQTTFYDVTRHSFLYKVVFTILAEFFQIIYWKTQRENEVIWCNFDLLIEIILKSMYFSFLKSFFLNDLRDVMKLTPDFIDKYPKIWFISQAYWLDSIFQCS